MKRFFLRTPFNDADALQDYVNQNIGEDIVRVRGEGRSYNGLEPWDFFFSSGIVDEEIFISLKTYVKNYKDIVLLEWDSMDWAEIGQYYLGLYTESQQ